MRTITLTDGAIDYAISHRNIESMENKPFVLGSKKRTINGNVISYSYGKKNNWMISLKDVSEEMLSSLLTLSQESTELEITINDGMTDAEIYSFDGIIDIESGTFKNDTNLHSASLTIMGFE